VSCRRAIVAALVASALAGASGCGLAHRMTGPAWSERRPPLDSGFEVADHRASEGLRFAVLGDAGTGKAGQIATGRHLAETCEARGGCDFVLIVGDNIYPAGVRGSRGVEDPRFEERFEGPFAPLGRLDMWAVPGNHDWFTPGSADTEVEYTRSSPRWRMPAHDYAVPGLPDWLRIYGLDSVKLNRGRDDGQLERARETLCGDDGWKLLFGHHPLYSSGRHADREGAHPRMIERLAPLLAECGVHVYFAGHDHHQEHLSAPGFEQIVQGAAAELRRVRPVQNRPPGVESVFAASRLGFALVEIDPHRMEIRFFGHADGEPLTELHRGNVSLSVMSTSDDPTGTPRMESCASSCTSL